jgi:N-acetylglucosaminyldiphosphoundecaprenol N-acetyl-beta-D-mannosaminyltransferase
MKSTVNILGVPFLSLTMDELISSINADLSKGKKIKLAFSNPEFVVETFNNKFIKKYLSTVDYNVADGIGIVLASKLIGDQVLPERITGTDFVDAMSKLCIKHDYSIFLYGGKPGVAEKAKDSLRDKYKNLKIAGTLHGFHCNDKFIVDEINKVNPDFLMVCLGNPKQEIWIEKNYSNLNAKIIFGNGGAMDFASGRVKRAPRIIIKCHMEWLYRLLQDFNVARIRRQMRLFVFSYHVLFNYFRKIVLKA